VTTTSIVSNKVICSLSPVCPGGWPLLNDSVPRTVCLQRSAVHESDTIPRGQSSLHCRFRPCFFCPRHGFHPRRGIYPTTRVDVQTRRQRSRAARSTSRRDRRTSNSAAVSFRHTGLPKRRHAPSAPSPSGSRPSPHRSTSSSPTRKFSYPPHPLTSH
jgi:hypothetical protein